MKTNEEFKQSVLDKSRTIITHRRQVRKRVMTSLSTLSVIVILMSGVYIAINNNYNSQNDNTVITTAEAEAEVNDHQEIEDMLPTQIAGESCTVTLSGIYVNVSSDSENYSEMITDEAAVKRLTEWVNQLVSDNKNIDKSTFVITVHNNEGDNVIYLPDEKAFFNEFKDVIN